MSKSSPALYSIINNTVTGLLFNYCGRVERQSCRCLQGAHLLICARHEHVLAVLDIIIILSTRTQRSSFGNVTQKIARVYSWYPAAAAFAVEFQGAEQLATFMTSTESMSMTFMKSLSTSIASSPRPSARRGLTSKRRSISCLVNSTQGRPWVVLPTTSAGTVPNHHRMSCTMQSVLLMDHTALAKTLVFKPETVKGSHTQIHTDAHAHTHTQHTHTHSRARAGRAMFAPAFVAKAGTPEASNPASHLCFCQGFSSRHDER